ncbi:hypothetical protein ON010_g8141 [Phytophthora cinnamomi]|nr:hypothetical protein ON010_g8141 [Phytophthora cinnamomi]
MHRPDSCPIHEPEPEVERAAPIRGVSSVAASALGAARMESLLSYLVLSLSLLLFVARLGREWAFRECYRPGGIPSVGRKTEAGHWKIRWAGTEVTGAAVHGKDRAAGGRGRRTQRSLFYACGVSRPRGVRANSVISTWMHEHFPGVFSIAAMDAAARNGHIDVITWLHKHRKEGCSHWAPYNAAQNGQLAVLKWLHIHYPHTFRPIVMDGAAGYGHLEVVRWLHENRPESCKRDAMWDAAANGHLDVFLYLLEHRTEGFWSCVMYEDRGIQVTCHFSSDIRKYQRSNRATSDQLKMLQNVLEQRPAFFGIELLSIAPLAVAVGGGHVEVLRWFFENGFEVTDPRLLEMAVEDCRLGVVPWLLEHGYAVNSLVLIKTAVYFPFVPVLRWLVEHGPPLNSLPAARLIFKYSFLETAWWVAEDIRRLLVLDALQGCNRRILWWILAHTQFEDESVRRSIRDAIQRCSADTRRWHQDNMSDVETCSWCFSKSVKRRIEETEATASSRLKHKNVLLA